MIPLNISTFISAIALIISVLSSVLNPLISSRYQLKIKKLELITPRQIEVIDNYIKHTTACVYGSNINKFNTYKDHVLIYISNKPLKFQIIELNKLVVNGEYDKAKPLLTKISAELSKEINIK